MGAHTNVNVSLLLNFLAGKTDPLVGDGEGEK